LFGRLQHSTEVKEGVFLSKHLSCLLLSEGYGSSYCTDMHIVTRLSADGKSYVNPYA